MSSLFTRRLDLPEDMVASAKDGTTRLEASIDLESSPPTLRVESKECPLQHEQVLDWLEELTHLSAEDIMGPRKTLDIMNARHIYRYILRTALNYSHQKTASLTSYNGDKADHQLTIHSCKQVAKRRKSKKKKDQGFILLLREMERRAKMMPSESEKEELQIKTDMSARVKYQQLADAMVLERDMKVATQAAIAMVSKKRAQL